MTTTVELAEQRNGSPRLAVHIESLFVEEHKVLHNSRLSRAARRPKKDKQSKETVE